MNIPVYQPNDYGHAHPAASQQDGPHFVVETNNPSGSECTLILFDGPRRVAWTVAYGEVMEQKEFAIIAPWVETLRHDRRADQLRRRAFHMQEQLDEALHYRNPDELAQLAADGVSQEKIDQMHAAADAAHQAAQDALPMEAPFPPPPASWSASPYVGDARDASAWPASDSPYVRGDLTHRVLTAWTARRAHLDEQRDGLIRWALDQGATKSTVHSTTGIARTTIDRVVAE